MRNWLYYFCCSRSKFRINESIILDKYAAQDHGPTARAAPSDLHLDGVRRMHGSVNRGHHCLEVGRHISSYTRINGGSEQLELIKRKRKN